MDRSTPITLIKSAYVQDENGIPRKTETSRTVFASIESVRASEFFEGGRNGLNPELRFVMFRYDYDDETVIEYNGKRYGVYRTYLAKNDTIELYCERKGGTNK